MEEYRHILAMTEEILRRLEVRTTRVEMVQDEKTGNVRVSIDTPDSALLIGEHGTRLHALNHLVRRMAEQAALEDLRFSIDVNEYEKKRLDDLRAKAHILAERARYFRSTVELEPMSSYERMIVHAEFSDVPDLKTESSGLGKDRHIIIRFIEG